MSLNTSVTYSFILQMLTLFSKSTLIVLCLQVRQAEETAARILREKEEEAARQAAQQAKKEKEAQKKAIKKERQKLRTTCKARNPLYDHTH